MSIKSIIESFHYYDKIIISRQTNRKIYSNECIYNLSSFCVIGCYSSFIHFDTGKSQSSKRFTNKNSQQFDTIKMIAVFQNRRKMNGKDWNFNLYIVFACVRAVDLCDNWLYCQLYFIYFDIHCSESACQISKNAINKQK